MTMLKTDLNIYQEFVALWISQCILLTIWAGLVLEVESPWWLS